MEARAGWVKAVAKVGEKCQGVQCPEPELTKGDRIIKLGKYLGLEEIAGRVYRHVNCWRSAVTSAWARDPKRPGTTVPFPPRDEIDIRIWLEST